MKITCTNGNRLNGISGSRVRWTCKKCGRIVAEHSSPQRGPAGRYEHKHPSGDYARLYLIACITAENHVCEKGQS